MEVAAPAETVARRDLQVDQNIGESTQRAAGPGPAPGGTRLVQQQDADRQTRYHTEFLESPAQRFRIVLRRRQEVHDRVNHQKIKISRPKLQQMVDIAPPAPARGVQTDRTVKLQLLAEVQRRLSQLPQPLVLFRTKDGSAWKDGPAQQFASQAPSIQ